jgi:hypothetical protein
VHAAQGAPKQTREKCQAALAICDQVGEGHYWPHIERALAELESITASATMSAPSQAPSKPGR